MTSNQEFVFKQKNSTHGIVMIVTDKNIIGKKFENEKLQLDLTKEFYQGTEKSKEEILELLKKAYIVHFTGEKSIEIGLSINIIHKENIITIEGIPHAEAYLG